MWVYKKDSLQHRLRLDATLGFWVDYWLFLHGDETHPIWSARPLGIRAIAEAALSSTAPHDAILRQQLKREILAALKLMPYVSTLPPIPSRVLTDDKSAWEAVWIQWLNKLLQETDLQSLVTQIIKHLVKALYGNDFRGATFLTRRLAAELGGDEKTDRHLFMAVKAAFCDSGAFDDREIDEETFTANLLNIFVLPTNSSYLVEIALTPVLTLASALRYISAKALSVSPQLISERDDQNRPIITGIKCTVEATDPEQAKAIALKKISAILDTLRLRFYVMTHLYGVVKITNLLSGDEVVLSLPHPFWKKSRGMRELPSLPKEFNRLVSRLPDDERERWYATRWHMSQAFSDYAEDPHAAAAKMWQALEAFAPPLSNKSPMQRVAQLTHTYLDSIPTQIAEFLAQRVSLQVREIAVLELDSVSPNWYYWHEARIPVTKWLDRVLDKRSPHHFSTWTVPPAPAIAFDKDVGLIQTIDRRIKDGNSERWMEKRLESDIALLYGLRNKVVHSGIRTLSRQMAMYLVQLGAEMIFTVMGKASLSAAINSKPPVAG